MIEWNMQPDYHAQILYWKTRATHDGSKKSLNRLVLEKYDKKALSLNNLLELLQVFEDIISVSGYNYSNLIVKHLKK